MLVAIKTICAGTRKRGKIAGVHTDGAKTAIRRFGEGYQLCTILSDARLMANAAAAAVREARGRMAQAGAFSQRLFRLVGRLLRAGKDVRRGGAEAQ